jgi:hypothetical protein
MTRVALIGNSHLTAFFEASDTITARHPEVKLFFFGLDNQVFFKAAQLGGDALRVADPVDANTRQVIDPTAENLLNFADFDLVLLTSHGFYLRHLYEALGCFNVLGLGALDAVGPVVSRACLHDAMAAHVNSYTRRLRGFLPAADNAVVVQMPYPSVEAVGLSAALAGMHAQPDRPKLFEMFNTLVAARMFDKGLPYFPVPEDFLDSPFFTKAQFARKTAMPAGQAVGLTDYMHMNADYAAAMFGHIHGALLAGA